MRVGSETPRIYTPPLRELTPETSLGFHVIAFAEDVLHIDLHPWQRWLLIHMLELLPDNTLRFRTVVVLVARQNGKSLISQVLALWFMYVYGLPLVLGTAQDLDTAEEVWQGAVDLVEELDEFDEPVRPALHDLLDRVIRVNGKKALVVNRPPHTNTGKPQRRYKVKAANRRAGRGLSGDLILLDELREHQTWDAWGSITKTTMARAMALILCLSNAGDATSVVLRYLRKATHAAIGDPDGINAEIGTEDLPALEQPDDGLDASTIGIFEWSARPGCAVDDRDEWAQANPSMNLPNGIAERTIAAACSTDPEFVFRPEVLCQWLDTAIDGPFPAGAWEAGRIEQPGQADRIIGPVKACIEISHDRTMTYIAFAGRRADGLVQVEIVAQRAGTDWVREWLTAPKRRDRISAVTGRARGAPVSGLIRDLADADDHGLTIVAWEGPALPEDAGTFYDLVRDSGDGTGLRHLPQPSLDVAAATAVTRPSGDRFLWDARNSPTDIAPLVAATGAVGLLLRPSPTVHRSAYETNDFVTA